MKFDFAIGNPPYQEEVKESTNQAKPVYHNFVKAAREIASNGVCMITPSRWYSGGMGLDAYRKEMLTNNNIKVLQDYPNGKECFPNTSISGGVCAFLIDNNYSGPAEIINIENGIKDSQIRYLNEYPIPYGIWG